MPRARHQCGARPPAGAVRPRIHQIHPSEPASAATATIVGVVTVLITASGVFGEMRTALNATFKAKPLGEPIF
jgi:membrane protein